MVAMPFTILNRNVLATSPLRRDALRIVQAGMMALDTARVVRRSVVRRGELLWIGKRVYHLRKYRRVFGIGIGKAAFDAGRELEKILGARLTDGIILDVKGGKLRRMKSIVGSHPFPSVENARATGEIMGLLKGADSRDLFLVIVSGGGSALLCWPYKLKCKDVTDITRALMRAGATIQELNTVRKHLSEIQGGQLARLAFPATVVGLLFSDVPGDELSMIASGPTVLDPTSVEDARGVLEKYHVLRVCRLPSCDLQETPKDPLLFTHVHNELVASNALALKAMASQARALGYKPVVYSRSLTGEAREVGAVLAGLPHPGEAVLAGGETTVTVRGKGRGGRNQEVALGALENLCEGSLVLALSTDGIDNSPYAGALVDDLVRDRVNSQRLRPASFLRRNDSAAFFESVGTNIKTGITGTNVSDLMIAILPSKRPKKS